MMIDDFQGQARIELQPEDSGVPYGFEVTVCSSVSSNDGAIPYGTNVTAITVKAYNLDGGTEVTEAMIDGTPEVTGNIIAVALNWPGTRGKYKLTFICTLTGGISRELDFKRIEAADK